MMGRPSTEEPIVSNTAEGVGTGFIRLNVRKSAGIPTNSIMAAATRAGDEAEETARGMTRPIHFNRRVRQVWIVIKLQPSSFAPPIADLP